jgi:hypothetical protein
MEKVQRGYSMVKHTKLTLKVRIYYKDKYDGSLFLS